MEKLNFGYSLKNIPTPDEKSYKLRLLEKIEISKKMRWKAVFFINNNKKATDDYKQGFSYGLKSGRSPPQVKDLIQFEDDLVRIVKELKFRKVKNNFQKMLREDMKQVQTSKKTLTPADKTSNMYRLNKNDYQNLLKNAITTTYKKANKNIGTIINEEGIKFAKPADILDKIEINGTGNSFVTLKDHKENFTNHPTTRLINPSKNEIGRICKHILDQINTKLISKLRVNEWKNTISVIKWFKNVNNKRLYKFLQFDIKDFYPSFKETLLDEAIQFAKGHVPITRKDVDVIFHARTSVLYNDGEPWVIKDGGSFDVTMGAYDGAEVCEVIGIYMLYLIGKKYDSKNIVLYRNDGLAVFKNVSGPASEKIKKQLQSLFKQKGMQIIIECKLKVVNYLDVTFNLNDGSYRPYRKPNDETHYIHIQSDHPPSIT